MKTATEITATSIIKIVGQPCWYVPSDSSEKLYKVCYDEQSANWSCECKHGEMCKARGMTANCKHVRAVLVSIQANKAEQERIHAEVVRWLREDAPIVGAQHAAKAAADPFLGFHEQEQAERCISCGRELKSSVGLCGSCCGW